MENREFSHIMYHVTAGVSKVMHLKAVPTATKMAVMMQDILRPVDKTISQNCIVLFNIIGIPASALVKAVTQVCALCTNMPVCLYLCMHVYALYACMNVGICFPLSLSLPLSVSLCLCLCVCLPVCLSLFVCLFVCLPACMPACLSLLSVCLYASVSVCTRASV